MIRTLLTTTALTALLTAGAFAQDATTTAPVDPNAPAANSMATDSMSPGMGQPFDMGVGYMSADTDDLASRILGTPVYSGPGDDAEQIGEVNDLVIAGNGSVGAVLIGVGGFLGIGEKNVAVSMSDLEMVLATDNTERWVLNTTREALEAAPAFEFVEDQPADMAVNSTATDVVDPAATDTAATTAPADTAMTAEPATTDTAMTADPAINPIDRTSLTNLDTTALTAEELIGTGVVGPDDQQIAEVGDLVLTPEGMIDAVLVDFGGFLGIGEKRVAVAMDNLEFATDAGGNRYVFLNSITREQLEAAPAYDADTYATDPAQRMTVGM